MIVVVLYTSFHCYLIVSFIIMYYFLATVVSKSSDKLANYTANRVCVSLLQIVYHFDVVICLLQIIKVLYKLKSCLYPLLLVN